MTSASRIDSARLSIVLDIRYPQAYLALPPAIEFARSMGIDVNWLPLAAATLKPPPASSEGDDRSTQHRRHRAHRIAKEIEIYSRAQGLTLVDLYRDGDAHMFNRAWLWMRDRHPDRLLDFLREGFRAYWARDLEPGRESEVVALVERFGGDRAPFLSWLHDDAGGVEEGIEAELHEHGVFAVPSYLVEGEIFLGRQHLPMIRWILEGREGPVPI